jgi:hypothetical protein
MMGFSDGRIRRLLQHWGWGQGGVELVSDILEIPETAAQELLTRLIDEGYVRHSVERQTTPGWEYELTPKGTTFIQVSDETPFPRDAVRNGLRDLIQRMTQVNSDERFVVGIEAAFVVGDYLNHAEHLGALEIHYTTYRKITERSEFTKVAHRVARASGRKLSNDMSVRLWPEDEVTSFLENHAGMFYLITNMERRRDDETPRLVIFRERAPVPDWRDL